MADFLTRLAERTLGLVPVVQPVIAPMFAPGLPMTGTAPGTEALDTSDETQEVPASKHSPTPQRNREVDNALIPPPAQKTRRSRLLSQLQFLASRTGQPPDPSQPLEPAVTPIQSPRAVHMFEAGEQHRLAAGAPELTETKAPPVAAVRGVEKLEQTEAETPAVMRSVEERVPTNSASEGYNRGIPTNLHQPKDSAPPMEGFLATTSDSSTNMGRARTTSLRRDDLITHQKQSVSLRETPAERTRMSSVEDEVDLTSHLEQAAPPGVISINAESTQVVEAEGIHVAPSSQTLMMGEKAVRHVQSADRTSLVDIKAGSPSHLGLQMNRASTDSFSSDLTEHVEESLVEPAIAAPSAIRQKGHKADLFIAQPPLSNVAPVVILRQTIPVQQLLVPEVQYHQDGTQRQAIDPATFYEQSSGIARHRPASTPLQEQDVKVAAEQSSATPTAGRTSSTSSAPTIRVTIGRIDVRAVTQPATPARPKSGIPGPALSLDDYLKQRKGGER